MHNRPHRQKNCSGEFIPSSYVDLKLHELFHGYGFLPFHKESNFVDFLFAFLEDESFPNGCPPLKKRIYPIKLEERNMAQLLSLKLYPFTFNVRFLASML